MHTYSKRVHIYGGHNIGMRIGKKDSWQQYRSVSQSLGKIWQEDILWRGKEIPVEGNSNLKNRGKAKGCGSCSRYIYYQLWPEMGWPISQRIVGKVQGVYWQIFFVFVLFSWGSQKFRT